MTATAAKSGFGTLLQLSDGASPPVFASIAEIANLQGPGLSRTMIDATHMESADAVKDYAAGIIDIGQASCDCNFLPADTSQSDKLDKLQAAAASTRFTYRVVWPDFGATALTVTVDTSTDVWTTASAHGWHTGQPVKLSTTGSLPTSSPQVTSGGIYYAKVLSTTTFTLHPSSADAVAGTSAIDASSTGSGTHTANGGTSWTFDALVQGFSPSAPKNDRLSANIVFQAASNITVSPTAP